MKKVRFSVGTKYVGSAVEEFFTLEELGIDEDLEGDVLEKEIQEAFKDWLWENIDTSYGVDED